MAIDYIFILGAFFIIIAVLVFPLVRHFLKHKFIKSRYLKLISLNIPGTELHRVLNLLTGVAGISSLEISVQNLGKTVGYYLVAPEGYIGKIKEAINQIFPDIKIHEVDDYQLFNYSGISIGKYLELTLEELKGIKLGFLDFSPVNEVGEGAVVQIVKLPRRKFEVRVLASAPSESQANEIMESLGRSALHTFKLKTPKDPKKFLHLVNFREKGFRL